jgi:hypothetical protein
MYACLVEATAVADVVVLFVEAAAVVAAVVVSVAVVVEAGATVVVVSVAAKSGGVDKKDNTVVQSKIGNNLISIFLIIKASSQN